jgi:hypothetical protein
MLAIGGRLSGMARRYMQSGSNGTHAILTSDGYYAMQMTDISKTLGQPATSRNRLALLLLLYLHVGACCLSSFYVVYYYRGYEFLKFLNYNPAHLYPALLNAAPLAVLAFFFVLCRFSFGYFLGFAFYTLVLGYLFFSKWSTFDYDHTLGSLSAFVSILTFLAPALFITKPVKQWIVLSSTVLDRVLALILLLAIVVTGAGAFYNFRIVSLSDIYLFRGQVEFPRLLSYAIGIFINALLPFAFACYHMLGKRWHAGTALVLLLLFYPITLTKLTLFAPFWLMFLAFLGWLFEIRIAVASSLFLLIAIGDLMPPLLASGALSYDHFIAYFSVVNFRLIAVPSIALDLYGDFFAKHSLTYFCQIGVLKSFVECPYNEYLSIVMSKNYPLGFVNASLFATEGIASVGPKLAPLSAFACGLIIAFANRLSSGLPPKFILLSGGLLVQIFLNIPMTTSLLSYGAALLFLLWYVTPRAIFEAPKATGGRTELDHRRPRSKSCNSAP